MRILYFVYIKYCTNYKNESLSLFHFLIFIYNLVYYYMWPHIFYIFPTYSFATIPKTNVRISSDANSISVSQSISSFDVL